MVAMVRTTTFYRKEVSRKVWNFIEYSVEYESLKKERSMSEISEHYNTLYSNEKMIAKSDYTIYFVYQKGKVFLEGVSESQVYEFAKEFKKSIYSRKTRIPESGFDLLKTYGFVVEPVFDEEGFIQACQDRKTRLQNYEWGFKMALFNYYGVEGTKAEKLYEICRNRSGIYFEEIEDCFVELINE